MNLGKEGIDTRLVAIGCRCLRAHFQRPRARGDCRGAGHDRPLRSGRRHVMATVPTATCSGLPGTTMITPSFEISARAISNPAAKTAFMARVTSDFLNALGRRIERVHLAQNSELDVEMANCSAFNRFQFLGRAQNAKIRKWSIWDHHKLNIPNGALDGRGILPGFQRSMNCSAIRSVSVPV